MAGPSFDWSQYAAEDSAGPAPQGKGGKFDWSQYPGEGEAQTKTDDDHSGFLTSTARSALGGIAQVGQTLDRYGGAPTRAALGSLINSPSQPGQAIDAFKNQFGADPTLAPTGKDLAAQAGMSTAPILSPESQKAAAAMAKGTPFGFLADKVLPGSVENAVSASPAGIAGVGVDVAADPLTYLPLGRAAKGIVGVAAKSADRIGEAAAASGRLAKNLGTTVTSKVGGLLTGVPEREIQTFVEKYPEVQKMIAEHGDDIAGAANDVRQAFQSSLRTRRGELGNQIGQALGALPDEKAVPIAPVIDSLNQVKNRMNSSLRFEEVKQVDDLIGRIHDLAGEGGKVTPREMFDIKEFLQDRASGSYMKDGQIFVPGKDAQLAAKSGAAQARQIVNTMSPTVADANNQLFQLHQLQDRINTNLIAPNKPDAALLGAGSGLNARNVKDLQDLGAATKTDMLGAAQQYAAAKRFASPGLSSADTTGKGVERALKASIVGQALGGPVAAGAAAVLTSPMALKVGIQAGRIPVAAIQKIAGVTGELSDATIQRAYQVLKTPEGQAAFNAALQGAKTQSIVGRSATPGQPATGEDLWAQQGVQKLGISDQALSQRILQDPKARQLLIQASDLTPGSRAMKDIMNQIQKGWGKP